MITLSQNTESLIVSLSIYEKIEELYGAQY
jgi:hypothetical protein